MVKVKVNIFNVISIVGTLLLIGYSWLILLPTFEGSSEYPAIRTIVIYLTILLIVAALIQVFLAIRTEEEPK